MFSAALRVEEIISGEFATPDPAVSCEGKPCDLLWRSYWPCSYPSLVMTQGLVLRVGMTAILKMGSKILGGFQIEVLMFSFLGISA